jgi:hypothetical protein
MLEVQFTFTVAIQRFNSYSRNLFSICNIFSFKFVPDPIIYWLYFLVATCAVLNLVQVKVFKFRIQLQYLILIFNFFELLTESP